MEQAEQAGRWLTVYLWILMAIACIGGPLILLAQKFLIESAFKFWYQLRMRDESYHNEAMEPELILCCPKCQADMKLRTVKKGEKKGQQFLVCVNYPECRGLIAVK